MDLKPPPSFLTNLLKKKYDDILDAVVDEAAQAAERTETMTTLDLPFALETLARVIRARDLAHDQLADAKRQLEEQEKRMQQAGEQSARVMLLLQDIGSRKGRVKFTEELWKLRDLIRDRWVDVDSKIADQVMGSELRKKLEAERK